MRREDVEVSSLGLEEEFEEEKEEEEDENVV